MTDAQYAAFVAAYRAALAKSAYGRILLATPLNAKGSKNKHRIAYVKVLPTTFYRRGENRYFTNQLLMYYRSLRSRALALPGATQATADALAFSAAACTFLESYVNDLEPDNRESLQTRSQHGNGKYTVEGRGIGPGQLTDQSEGGGDTTWNKLAVVGKLLFNWQPPPAYRTTDATLASAQRAMASFLSKDWDRAVEAIIAYMIWKLNGHAAPKSTAQSYVKPLTTMGTQDASGKSIIVNLVSRWNSNYKEGSDKFLLIYTCMSAFLSAMLEAGVITQDELLTPAQASAEARSTIFKPVDAPKQQAPSSFRSGNLGPGVGSGTMSSPSRPADVDFERWKQTALRPTEPLADVPAAPPIAGRAPDPPPSSGSRAPLNEDSIFASMLAVPLPAARDTFPVVRDPYEAVAPADSKYFRDEPTEERKQYSYEYQSAQLVVTPTDNSGQPLEESKTQVIPLKPNVYD